MKLSKYGLLALPVAGTAAFLSLMISAPSLPVSAQVSQEQTAEVSTVMEKIPEDDPAFQKQEEVKETEMDPLTPDGNLTLVDDEGPHAKNGKQFITVTSKSGNYFYIIIDRDDEGENTVHFLNLVDEADLMALLDEETKDQMNAADAIRAAEEARIKAEKEAEEAQEAAKAAAEASQTGTQKKASPLPAVLTLAALAAGGAGYFYYSRKKAEEEKSSHPDPDDDEYWLDEDDADHREEQAEDNEPEAGESSPKDAETEPDEGYSESEPYEDGEDYREDENSAEASDDLRIEEWN